MTNIIHVFIAKISKIIIIFSIAARSPWFCCYCSFYCHLLFVWSSMLTMPPTSQKPAHQAGKPWTYHGSYNFSNCSEMRKVCPWGKGLTLQSYSGDGIKIGKILLFRDRSGFFGKHINSIMMSNDHDLECWQLIDERTSVFIKCVHSFHQTSYIIVIDRASYIIHK